MEALTSRKMADGKLLADASHNNTVTGSDLTVESLSEMRVKMRLQKALGSKSPLGLSPAVLVVGPALETKAQQLVASITAAQTSNVNPFAGAQRTAPLQSRTDLSPAGHG